MEEAQLYRLVSCFLFLMLSHACVAERLLFVSLSMPDNVLIPLLQQADEKQVPVLIRGLVNNDLQQTQQRLKQLMKKTSIQGVSVDPIAFERFDVKRVPTLVIENKNQWYKVAGNVSLQQLMETIEQSSQVTR